MPTDQLSALCQAVEAALSGGPPVTPKGWQPPGNLPPEAALVVRSSGSTGQPKLVWLTAAAVKASAKASAQRLGGSGHWLLTLPTEHIAGLNVVARAVLAGTAPTAMTSPFTTAAFIEATRTMPPGRHFVSLVPTQLDRLLSNAAAVAHLSHFTAILLGGAAVPPHLMTQARQYDLPLHLTYGMAETGGGCVYDGVPLEGVQVRLNASEPSGPDLDSSADGSVLPDVTGRIELAGLTLAGGYLDQPAHHTAFTTRAGQRWYLSSDLGQWDGNGRLVVLGRLDHVIQTGGHKVAPELVERQVASHPGITQVAVTALPDQQWGQVVTALVTGPNPPSLDQLRTWLKDHGNQTAVNGCPPHPAQAGGLLRALGVVNQLPYLTPGKLDRAATAALAQRLDAAGLIERLR